MAPTFTWVGIWQMQPGTSEFWMQSIAIITRKPQGLKISASQMACLHIPWVDKNLCEFNFSCKFKIQLNNKYLVIKHNSCVLSYKHFKEINFCEN